MQKASSQSIHKKGQYFTKNIELKECIYKYILNNPHCILEPSVGRGDLVDFIQNKKKNIKFDMYEIDNNIKLLDGINKHDIIYCDFLTQDIDKKYNTIIGNPPYIKNKNGNIYIKFIEKCYDLLNENGELIFIVPSDFFKLTSSVKIINLMLENGNFTHIFHPNKENYFENASIDIIIFRYCKNKHLNNVVKYNDCTKYLCNSNGLIFFSDIDANHNDKISDYFDVYVGMVSGKEDIYKNNEIGNMQVLNGENKIDTYIFVEKYPSGEKKIDKYLIENKKILIERKIKKFNEKNWYEWGAPRNIQYMKKYMNDDCIYIYNLTRNNNVAFKGKIMYFGGGLLMLRPKKYINLDKFIKFLNDEDFKNKFLYSGRFKIGHRQISNFLFDASNFM